MLLGRSGSSLLSNEEVSLCKKLWNKGVQMYYAPDAVVYHRVPAVRATRRWLLRRIYWQGISDVVLEEDLNPSARVALVRHALGTLRHAMGDVAGAVLAQLHRNPTDALLHALYLVGRLGRVRQQMGYCLNLHHGCS